MRAASSNPALALLLVLATGAARAAAPTEAGAPARRPRATWALGGRRAPAHPVPAAARATRALFSSGDDASAFLRRLLTDPKLEALRIELDRRVRGAADPALVEAELRWLRRKGLTAAAHDAEVAPIAGDPALVARTNVAARDAALALINVLRRATVHGARYEDLVEGSSRARIS